MIVILIQKLRNLPVQFQARFVPVLSMGKNKSCVTLKSLKENKQFTIAVAKVPKSNTLSVSIRCKTCNYKHCLYPKKRTYILSNWTRHVKK